MSNDRRAFFKKAAGAAVGLAGADAFLGSSAHAAGPDGPASAVTRSVSAARFALELEGKLVGFLKSFEGGEVSANVTDREKDSCGAAKQIGPPVFGPISVEWNGGMSEELFSWIASFLSCESQDSRSGAIVAADLSLKEVFRLEFEDALITEIDFPPLDAASKDAGSLMLKFAPAKIKRQPGSGAALKTCSTSKQRSFSAFRLVIDGLDCTKVSKIGPLSIRQDPGPVGEEKPQPGKMNYSDLVVTLAESAAATFFDYQNSFILDGKNGPENEKTGRLELLGPNLKDQFFVIGLSGLGIFRLAMDKMEANTTEIKRVTAEMYSTRLTVEPGKFAFGC
jgi:hypothetical protein